MNGLRKFWLLIKDTAIEWKNDNSMLLSAALSFFMIFSIVPILILTIAVSGKLLGMDQARSEILQQIEIQSSPQAAEAIRYLISSSQQAEVGLASFLSIILLMFLATRVFNQLQNALNIIWGIKKNKENNFFIKIIKQRLLSFVMVIGNVIFIFAFFFVDAALQAVSSSVGNLFPYIPDLIIWKIISYTGSLILFTFLFALVYKVLPDAKISWGDVWIGGFVTSLLFALGRYVMTLYFRISDVGNLYGAAGSLIILMLWIYYTTQIFLYGAEFTWVYTNRYGSRSHRDPTD